MTYTITYHRDYQPGYSSSGRIECLGLAAALHNLAVVRACGYAAALCCGGLVLLEQQTESNQNLDCENPSRNKGRRADWTLGIAGNK